MSEFKAAEYVDLDGTLAKASGMWGGRNDIGEPVPKMLERVKNWLARGVKVVVFTARADDPGNIPPIREWLNRHVGQVLPVTNKKRPEARRIWDDRAVTVERNTGRILSRTRRKAREMSV